MTTPPLILTLMLDETSQEFFNEQRKKYFPAERNYLDAHLTLFHHLPANENKLLQDIALVMATYKTMQLQVTDIKHTGRGLAYKIECDVLLQMHRYMQQLWSAWLIPQDQHRLWPHITIQNKVSADDATLLKAQLDRQFTPFTAAGIGLALYQYLGGPWKFQQSWLFGH
jgi:hypothetical protein